MPMSGRLPGMDRVGVAGMRLVEPTLETLWAWPSAQKWTSMSVAMMAHFGKTPGMVRHGVALIALAALSLVILLLSNITRRWMSMSGVPLVLYGSRRGTAHRGAGGTLLFSVLFPVVLAFWHPCCQRSR